MKDNHLYKRDLQTNTLLEFVDGDWVLAGDPVPIWQHRRIVSMNLLSRNEKKNISEWELTLDCQHTIREDCDFWGSPKGLYHDCLASRRH